MSETFTKPDPQVAVRQETKQSLVVIGLALLLLGIALIVFTWSVGSKTTETPPDSSASAKTATEKVTKTRSAPSEGLITAILGTGGALVVLGFLFGRISSIKLPGGVELAMGAKEKAIKKSIEKHPGDPDKAAIVAETAQALLRQEPGDGEPSDDAIERAVDVASAAT